MAKAFSNRAKREGFKKKHKSTFVEKLSSSLPMLVPFINVIIILVAIFNQEAIYEKTIKDMIKIDKAEEPK